MKFALVNGEKTEATLGAKGICRACGSDLIAKCGEIKIHHWAHKGNRNCDPWWENEKEWHRGWKGHFPVDWQEIIHRDKNGEKHIADVKTDQGWVLEFQHSYLKPQERRERDAFYQNLVWVVDGTRRERDIPQFKRALSEGAMISAKLKIHSVFSDECALLREWVGCRASVFFDFAEGNKSKGGSLWWLLPWSPGGSAFVLPFSRADFIGLHQTKPEQGDLDFRAILKILIESVSRFISKSRAQTRAQELQLLAQQQQFLRSRGPKSRPQYSVRKGRRRL
ncbi:competence protein CoiA family protein [uncultured Desulfosarcina sp.]|uniref:competence protein CoiA n=1 Tax=uncultured Desulfosarcina sp. TaxID=218289 RepID=UPI0029C81E4D|nr:competence protein CoiA family protein [uncultured Desulfosarcina sp.]